MLVNAMGVSGVEGNYRCTCESVMGVLRHHKDSVRPEGVISDGGCTGGGQTWWSTQR